MLVARRDAGPACNMVCPAGAGTQMNDDDLALRNLTYARFVELGRAPTADEVAVVADRDRAEVMAGWERLHAEHALVLDQAGGIRMANPFSGVPTAYRVQADGRWWYGNCAWDAFGVLSALKVDGRIESSCPDCGEPYAVEVVEQTADRHDLLFH